MTPPYPPSIKQRLPPEIIDQIIDQLRGDNRALSKCNLVCRSWRPAARYHLFYEVKLSGKMPHALSILFRGLTSLSLTIRILNVSEVASNIHNSSSIWDQAFSTLGSSLPALHTLRLTNVYFSQLSSASISSVIHGFRSVKNLHMSSVIFHSLEDFMRLIQGHKQLEELAIRNVWWESEEPEESLRQSATGTISYISFTTPCRVILQDVSHRIYSWLASGRCPLNIVSLEYCTTMDHNLTSLDNLLSKFGSNLHKLSLNLHPMMHTFLIAPGFQYPQLLSRCPSLESLEFVGIVLSPPLSRGYGWILNVLEQASVDQLEVISFHLLCNQLSALNQVPWNGISRILSNPIYKRLRKVVFHLKGDTNNRAKTSITERLSSLCARGVGLEFLPTY
ncbi:hypothetical protein M422DRAFT_263827 [Sphaerobolus stellatus SS14]|uniref:F-box domain-containing protein n=1 Tax=Sphaerobolus stellatus (strain SS14) TaxID=990650 RepID=A0A0C9VA18_SPHS4|nr:hypothetical protein M422DRAFT_263827 [Sphaerobolus stellatus SS14]